MDDSGVVRRLWDDVAAAYNAHDYDTFRSLFAPDYIGFDHRLVSLGRYDIEKVIAYVEALRSQVRSHQLVVLSIETGGNAGLFRTLETAETVDGTESSWETVTVGVVVDGRFRSADVFAPEAEADARALFEELVASASP